MPAAPLRSLIALLASTALFASTRGALASPAALDDAAVDDAVEAALEDGEVDAEDVAVHDPWSSLAPARTHGTLLGGGTGATYLSIVGFSRRATDGRRDVGGLLVVGLPLDRFARGGRRTGARASNDRALPELTFASGQLRVRPAAVSVAAPFGLALTTRLARACVAAAWRAAGLGPDDARLDGLVARARWSAVLPEARLRAIRSDDARLSLDTTTTTDTSKIRDSAGANMGFEARLTWRLNRLLYADQEPSIERIRTERRDARARIGARVLDALFHWQRAALDLQTLPPDQRGTRDEADVGLRVLEAAAALDVLTSGWFSAYGPHVSGRTEPQAAPDEPSPAAASQSDL